MSVRLQQAEDYARNAQNTVRSLEQERDGALVEANSVKGESKDLAMQVQTLLRSRLTSPSSSAPLLTDGSGSDPSGLFTNVEELVSTNQKQVKEINNLKATLEQLQRTDEKGSLNARLNAAINDLNLLREERSKQEVMVTAIVEQRDMYRTLLAQSDKKYDPNIGKDSAKGSNDKQIEVSSTTVVELRANLNAAELQVEKLTEQITRAKDFESTLTKHLDEARTEASKLRLEASRNGSDATHYKQKCERLTKSFEGLEKELANANSEKVQFQNSVVTSQQRVNTVENELATTRQRIGMLEGELNTFKVSLEVATSAETRAQQSAESMRKELARQEALIESVKRIEAGLTNQNAEEKVRS
jgi:nucleoprotein TPR